MPLSPLEMERLDEWEQAIDVDIKGVLWGAGDLASVDPDLRLAVDNDEELVAEGSLLGEDLARGCVRSSATRGDGVQVARSSAIATPFNPSNCPVSALPVWAYLQRAVAAARASAMPIGEIDPEVRRDRASAPRRAAATSPNYSR
jgi:hypothetical protein